MLKLIFWVFVLLLALSFFGISIEKIIMSPAGQANFGYAIHWVLVGWNWFIGTIQHTARVFGL